MKKFAFLFLLTLVVSAQFAAAQTYDPEVENFALTTPLAELSGNISLDYTIRDDDPNQTDVYVYFRPNNDPSTPYQLATITHQAPLPFGYVLGDNPFEVTPFGIYPNPKLFNGTIIWDSATDLAGIDSDTVEIAMRPYNIAPPGQEVWGEMVILTLHVDNNTPPTVFVTDSPTTDQCGLVNVEYQLVDATNDLCRIEVFFEEVISTGPIVFGPAQPATIITPTDNLLADGSIKTLTWDSVTDGLVSGDYARLLIIPYDGIAFDDMGISDYTDIITFMCNEIPYATIEDPAPPYPDTNYELWADIDFNYTVTDPDTYNQEWIRLEYSVNGINWNNATITAPAPGPFQVGPTNPTYFGTFTWDTIADMDGMDIPGVRFRIQPYDIVNTGLWVSTNPFHVDNNDTSTVTIDSLTIPSLGVFCDTAEVFYTITDPENDQVFLDVAYQIWDGFDWGPEMPATCTGLPIETARVAAPYSGSFTWQADLDGVGTGDTARLVLRSYDGPTGYVDASLPAYSISLNFECDELPTCTISRPPYDPGHNDYHGNITFTYSVTDIDSFNNEGIRIEYSLNGASGPWNLCTTNMVVNPFAVGPTDPTTTGTVVWLIATDLPLGADERNVVVRATAYDNFSLTPREGGQAMTDVFHVDNNIEPISILDTASLAINQCYEVQVDFGLSDVENDLCDVTNLLEYRYLISPGIYSSWATATVVVDPPLNAPNTYDLTSATPPAADNHFIIWQAYADGMTSGSIAQLRIRALDEDSGVEGIYTDYGLFDVSGDIIFDCSDYPTPYLTTPVGLQNDNISIGLTVTEDDCTTANILAWWSDDFGTSWTQATLVPPVNPFDVTVWPAEYNGAFIWDSAADLGSVEADNLMIRVRSREWDNVIHPFHYQFDETTTFTLDNNLPPWVEVPDDFTNKGNPVDIPYTLFDEESDLCSIVAQYYFYDPFLGPIGPFPATPLMVMGVPITPTTNLSSSPTGTLNTFKWDSNADLVSGDAYIIFEIIPSDNDLGLGDTSNIFYVDPTNMDPTAAIGITTPPGEENSGLITFYYTVGDAEYDDVIVRAFFTVDGTTTHAATLAVPGINPFTVVVPVPSGIASGMIVWDSDADIPGIDANTVVFTIKAQNIGLPEPATASTNPFHVDNNDVPYIISVRPDDESIVPQTGNVIIRYSLADNESDICSIVPEYTINGIDYFPASPANPAELVNVISSETTGTINYFTWNSVADVPQSAMVKIRITPFDNDEGISNESIFFKVANIGQPLTIVSDYGPTTPDVGTHFFTSGTLIQASAPATVTAPGEIHTCAGWIAQGSAPASHIPYIPVVNQVPDFTLDEPTTITWLWDSSYEVTAVVDPAGSETLKVFTTTQSFTCSNSCTEWFPEGASLNFFARDISLDAYFEGFDLDDDGIVDTKGTTAIHMGDQGWMLSGVIVTAPVKVTAYYQPATTDYTLQIISNPDYCVSPSQGTYLSRQNTWVSGFYNSCVPYVDPAGTTRYTIAGYHALGDSEVDGDHPGETSFGFEINENTIITWDWTREFFLDTNVDPTTPVLGGWVLLDDGITPAEEFYAENSSVTVIAVPATGYNFEQWTGDLSGNSTTGTVTMNSPKSITAHFVPAVTPSPTPSPTPTPNDIDNDGLLNDCETDDPALLVLDGVTTWTNVMLPDSDGDGLLDGQEAIMFAAGPGCTSYLANLAQTDPRKRDTDGDKLSDGLEVLTTFTDPLDPNDPPSYTDADNDNLPDTVDPDDNNPDTDGDRFTDGYETDQGDDPNDPLSYPELGDVDCDGITNNVDALRLFYYALGYRPAPPCMQNSDIIPDGIINNLDATVMFNWTLENIPYLPMFM